MTKIVILDQKLIVPNDYLQFWAHFEWFLSLFQISEVNKCGRIPVQTCEESFILISGV